MEDTNNMEEMLRTNREENERYIEEKTRRLGILPTSERYSPVMVAPMEDVEANPERFIMTECLPACRILWDKNIYTFMVSDAQNEEAWIELFADGLSDDNKEYLVNLEEKGVHIFSYHQGTISFGVGCFGEKAQQKLIEIANGFEMQDVCKSLAYVDVETALYNVGCTKRTKNPNYVRMEEPKEGDLRGMLDYYDWLANGGPDLEYIEIFDSSKVKEPLEENFKGTDYVYVPEEDRVYLNSYHYRKHKKYLEYLQNMENNQGLKF